MPELRETRTRRRSVLVGLGALALSGCGSKRRLDARIEALLEAPNSVDVLRLEPHRRARTPAAVGENLEGCEVVARATLPPTAHKKVIDTWRAALDPNGVSAACFDPHHAIVVRKGSATLSLVICFGCGATAVNLDDQLSLYLVTRDILEPFEAVLRDTGVPLPGPSPAESL